VRAVLIANRGDNDGGVVGQLLRDRGYVFEHWVREEAASWPALPPDVELVLPLGSDWSVYWPDISASVEAEAVLLRLAHERGIPIFGICFGGQILAHALGGRAERAERPEIGWFSVKWNVTEVTSADFLEKIAPTLWLQWHYDRFVPPVEARVLATGDLGAQAFIAGRSLGVQFHPEATPEIVERWSSGAGADELVRSGIDPDELREASGLRAVQSARSAEVLVDWFVRHVT
jgi:GMP synthase-like glutamine amidotransferase